MNSQQHRARMQLVGLAQGVGCVVLSVVGSLGCADPKTATGTVAGRVLIDGELVPRGQVTFHPVVEGPLLVGRIDEQGSFALRVGRGNPSNVDASLVPVGEYMVTVVVTGDPKPPSEVGAPPGAGPRVMHRKYGSRDTSGLRRSIAPGKNLFDFELLPAEQEESSDEAAAGAEGDQPEEEPENSGPEPDPGSESTAASKEAGETTEAVEGEES